MSSHLWLYFSRFIDITLQVPGSIPVNSARRMNFLYLLRLMNSKVTWKELDRPYTL